MTAALPPDFFALVPCFAGWPASFLVGYRYGYLRGLAEGQGYRAYVRFDQLALVPDVAAPPEPPALVQVGADRYIRFSWARLDRNQWRALWHTTATAELAGEGRPFSRAEVEEIRDLLIRRGVAAWKNPASRSQGWVISEPMRRAIVAHLGGVPHRAGADAQARANKAVHARMHAKNKEK